MVCEGYSIGSHQLSGTLQRAFPSTTGNATENSNKYVTKAELFKPLLQLADLHSSFSIPSFGGLLNGNSKINNQTGMSAGISNFVNFVVLISL